MAEGGSASCENKSRTRFAFALGTLLGQQREQVTTRGLPDDNLAYPVLVTFKTSTGSGFFVNTPNIVYFVTAKHVLFDENTGRPLDSSFELRSYSRDLKDATANVFDIDTTKIPKGNLLTHPTEDVAVVKIFSVDKNNPNLISNLDGVTIRQAAKQGIVGVALDTIKKLGDVLVGNDVLLMGYPRSLGLQALPQIDLDRPLLRKGIVAGQNLQKHSIILDCPVYFGNSGGPVIEIDQDGSTRRRFWVIGIAIQYVPYLMAERRFPFWRILAILWPHRWTSSSI